MRLPRNHNRCVPRGVILFLFIRYDACLGLIKSACKKADEDFDDPYIVRLATSTTLLFVLYQFYFPLDYSLQVLTVFHPHGNLPSALTASSAAAGKSSSSVLSTLSVDQCVRRSNAVVLK